MTTTLAPTAGQVRPSVRNRIGLVLAALLGLADIAALVAIGAPDEGTPGPPVAILAFCAVMGVVTLVTVVWTWRTGNRTGARLTSAARILSALTSVPAFFVEDVSAALVATAAIGIVLTVVAVALVLLPPARD